MAYETVNHVRMSPEALFHHMRVDPYNYCEVANFEPHFQQRTLLDAVRDEVSPYICVKSGQGPGKTCCSGHLMMWRVLRYPASQGVVTAPTMRQCKQWIKEIRDNLSRADPRIDRMLRWTTESVQIAGVTKWEVFTATASDPKKLQGIHNKHLTYLLEEASGIPREMVEQIEGTVSNRDFLMLKIGNPNDRDSDFFDCFTRNRHLYHCMTWDAEETALRRPDIVSPDRNELIAVKYGRDSDAYRIRVKGQFPRADPDAIFNIEDLEACTKTDKRECIGYSNVKSFGIDYARMGSDESVIMQRHGNAIINWEFFSHREPIDINARAFVLQHLAGWKKKDVVFIPDAGGMGQSLLATFTRSGRRVYEFHNGGTAARSDEYANRIAEAWFHLKALVEARRVHLPNDNRLLKQLSTRKYMIQESDGRTILEKKDHLKERIGESPDRADALCMAFYDHATMPSQSALSDSPHPQMGWSTRL
jgi:phage terminase large subunit